VKRIHTALILALLAGWLAVVSVQAQSTGLTIHFSRDFGYASGTGDVQGLFSVTASGPNNLSKVVFYIDDKVLGEVDKPPFKLQFTTDDYPLGSHQIQAVGTTADGQTIKSQVVTARFVTASEGTQAAMRIAVPILVLVFGSILVAALFPLLTGRKTISLPAGTQRSYPLGGGICPKCGRPFAFHIYGLKLLVARYERCPYCGKWSMLSYASTDKLRAAEQAELASASPDGLGQVQGLSEAEKLKRELDESKYHEG